MVDREAEINQQIAARVRALRADLDLSLDALAARSGVSRSTISLIERAETSPTAVVLDKLAVGLGVSLAALLDPPSAPGHHPGGPVARREEQPEWRDPGSGYVRRTVSPPGVPQPLRIAEVLFPPGARVAFDNGARGGRVHQQIWVLEGEIELTLGDDCHRLRTGDCLAMEPHLPAMFHNPTRKPVRYAVVIATEPPTLR
ncbi:MAG TPA: XRE family transcriptional regulator [Isosphaeraceae bacterium]